MKYTRELMEALYKGCDGNFSKMGKSIGVHPSTIASACRKYGFENNLIRPRHIPTPKTQAYTRTVQLLPIMNNTMISEKTGLSRERTRQIRDEHGIPSPFKHRRCSLIWNEDNLATLCKLDLAQYTRPEIANMLNVSTAQLHLKGKEIGIDLTVCRHSNTLIKYSKELLLDLYDKHNGIILHIGQEYVDNGTYPNLNAATTCFFRRYKKLGLKGKGERFIKGHNKGKQVKYTYEIIKPLWDKYNGNMSAIARELNTHNVSIWHACIRLGLHKPNHAEDENASA